MKARRGTLSTRYLTAHESRPVRNVCSAGRLQSSNFFYDDKMATNLNLPRYPVTADSLFECVTVTPEQLGLTQETSSSLTPELRAQACEMKRYELISESVSHSTSFPAQP